MLAGTEFFRSALRYQDVLSATARTELSRRYAGSLMGAAWTVLYPLLFLSAYLFVYMVVFRVRFPEYSELGYVIYVFTGLVPYMALMEAVSAGAGSVRQNIHLIRNFMLPIELVPLRCVLVAMMTQMVGLVMIAGLSAINGTLGWHLLTLPLVLLLSFLFTVGLVWVVASLGAVIPDIAYFVNIMLMMLMFVSPIAFKREMVPPMVRIVVDINPVTYLVEAFRGPLFYQSWPEPRVGITFVVMALGVYFGGASIFRVMRRMLWETA